MGNFPATCVNESDEESYESNKEDVVALAAGTPCAMTSMSLEGGTELLCQHIEDAYDEFDVLGPATGSARVQSGLSVSIKNFTKTSHAEPPKTYECTSPVDFSKISTTSLEELLKVDRVLLYDMIEEEYVRRKEFDQSDSQTSKIVESYLVEENCCCYVASSEDSAEKCVCYTPTLVCKICPACCCRKPMWCKPMTAEDHYILQTPIELESKYSTEQPMSPRILLDFVFSPSYSRAYYHLIKSNCHRIVFAQVVMIFLMTCVTFGLNVFGWKNKFVVETYFSLGLMFNVSFVGFFVPLYNWSLLNAIIRKFDFIFLMGNAFLIVGIQLVFPVEFNGVRCNGFVYNPTYFFYFFGLIAFFSLDALPLSVMNHHIKIGYMVFTLNFYISHVLFYSFTTMVEDVFGQDQVVYVGSKQWSVQSVYITCVWNVAIFYGRSVWTGLTHPSCYTLLRAVVKDNSVMLE